MLNYSITIIFFGLTNTLLGILASEGFQSQFTSPSFMPIKVWLVLLALKPI